MAKIHRVLVVLGIPSHIADLIKLAQTVVQSMAAHASWFPSPNPSLTVVTQHINDLDIAETAAQTKARGTAGARDVKAALVTADLQYLKGYVQQVADADPAEAESIITSAGMSIRKPTSRSRNEFLARQGDVSGVAVLLVKAAGGRAAYEWQMSLDQKSWTPLQTTVLTENVIQGLTPANTYNFRYRAITPAGAGEWSQVVSLLVT